MSPPAAPGALDPAGSPGSTARSSKEKKNADEMMIELADGSHMSIGPELTTESLKTYKVLWRDCQRSRIIDFSHNRIRLLSELNGALLSGFPVLRSLDLSRNCIQKLCNLQSLPALEKLNLEDNSLTSLRGLRDTHCARGLTHLNVAKNKLCGLGSLVELVQMRKLVALQVEGNNFCLDLQAEAFCVAACPRLSNLNGMEVTKDVRLAVYRWLTRRPEGKEVLRFLYDTKKALDPYGDENGILRAAIAAKVTEDVEAATVDVTCEAGSCPIRSAREEFESTMRRRLEKCPHHVGKLDRMENKQGGQDKDKDAKKKGKEKEKEPENEEDKFGLKTKKAEALLDWFSDMASFRPRYEMPKVRRSTRHVKLSELHKIPSDQLSPVFDWSLEMKFRSEGIAAYREKINLLKAAAEIRGHAAGDDDLRARFLEAMFGKGGGKDKDEEKEDAILLQSPDGVTAVKVGGGPGKRGRSPLPGSKQKARQLMKLKSADEEAARANGLLTRTSTALFSTHSRADSIAEETARTRSRSWRKGRGRQDRSRGRGRSARGGRSGSPSRSRSASRPGRRTDRSAGKRTVGDQTRSGGEMGVDDVERAFVRSATNSGDVMQQSLQVPGGPPSRTPSPPRGVSRSRQRGGGGARGSGRGRPMAGGGRSGSRPAGPGRGRGGGSGRPGSRRPMSPGVRVGGGASRGGRSGGRRSPSPSGGRAGRGGTRGRFAPPPR
uniref:U2A'/phosphoprotein 32 family A C-terminal domain-containing protein n=1 Tax=Chromera velia CCMP2878 TaxID=1169474 RepID=A0A0G4FBB4_9ALVE|eukprot:Cvel_3054.t1-p1 / transcript=Cvel_3054.t1 / gene=Cvel_3054 / organism=Chromera_velia_CCMP2878 / gene_product=hypothetical protein / transcript_product=hypothetical protein / location=Cvel_scaffold122:20301-27078(-) / protein_length=718 / sequence_SO=supercontig / SO=protein_coding / is_pseudo=false